MNESVAEAKIFSVVEFTRGMERLVARPGLASIRVSGEISGTRSFGAGHVGFTLKEGNATLDCIAFSDKRRAMPELADGSAVIATGAIQIRGDRSSYQMVVEAVERVGVGALHAELQLLTEKFRREGLFEDARKRPIPRFPRSIAFVSAERGKGAEDFVRELEQQAPYIRIERIETRVQGVGAEIDIGEALDRANRLDVDLIVLARGGGSFEDLFPFNREEVVRAIVRSTKPVVTAIGHRPDHHLADDVADAYFPTPSLAAAAIVGEWRSGFARVAEANRALGKNLRNYLLVLSQRADAKSTTLRRRTEAIVGRQRDAFNTLARRLEAANPVARRTRDAGRLTALTARLDSWRGTVVPRLAQNIASREQRLIGAGRSAASSLEKRLLQRAAKLNEFSPEAPLERGYAIVSLNGKPLRDADAAKPGEHLDVRLHHGTLTARVE